MNFRVLVQLLVRRLQFSLNEKLKLESTYESIVWDEAKGFLFGLAVVSRERFGDTAGGKLTQIVLMVTFLLAF